LEKEEESKDIYAKIARKNFNTRDDQKNYKK
jgi:hypothetical protein